MKSFEGAQKIIDQIRRERQNGCIQRTAQPALIGQKNTASRKSANPLLLLGALFCSGTFLLLLLFLISQKNVTQQHKTVQQVDAPARQNAAADVKQERISKKNAACIIHLKSGRKIFCKNYPAIRNGMFVLTESRKIPPIPLTEVVKIEGRRQ